MFWLNALVTRCEYNGTIKTTHCYYFICTVQIVVVIDLKIMYFSFQNLGLPHKRFGKISHLFPNSLCERVFLLLQ